ncbi:hypothetical protein [Bradyrhizobium sp. S69]|uniref:hypothetical protein n=1 Tax=Bradyrhizobium sp. S69 TaxID=1641856 RepID=UPI0032DEF18B
MLAAETETEKDTGEQILARPAILNIILVEAAARSQAAHSTGQRKGAAGTRICSDGEGVSTRHSALGNRGSYGIGNGFPGVFASADRCAAQRDPLRMPLGLYRALLQRPTGRHGVIAMPAKEHVEPFFELQGRGQRDRSAGRTQS